MEDLIVNVTQEDIDKGKRGNCSLCPIALALMRKFNLDTSEESCDSVSVGISRCSVHPVMDKDRTSMYFRLPDEASEFIQNFDSELTHRNNDLVKPFSFTLIPSR